MRLFAICVRDSATAAFHAPLFFPAIGMAERWFKDEVNSPAPDNSIARHPEDYELHLVGYFNSETAILEDSVPSQLLLRGIDCVRQPAAQAQLPLQ